MTDEEKLAEEYADNYNIMNEDLSPKSPRHIVLEVFKDGYNKAIARMKCCENCKHYNPCVTVNETIGNQCKDYYNGCNNSVYEPFSKWEMK